MFDYDKWQEIFGTIRKHKLRTFLTALGVFWGIFMLVFLMGSGRGMENGVFSNFGDRATNALYVWAMNTRLPYAGLQAGRRVILNEKDVEAIRVKFSDEIRFVAPRMHVPTPAITRGGKTEDFEVRGETPELQHIEPIKIREGRFINPLDLKYRRKILVIGHRVQELLFEEEEDPIGQYLSVAGAEYKVVGIFESSRGGEESSEDERTLIMPLTTAQLVRNQVGIIDWFVCTMHDEVKVSSIEDQVVAMLKERHKVHPDDEEGIGNFNLEKEFGEVMGLFFGIRLIIWVVGIGSLLAGVIGVGNIMLIIVKERTKEIGIRKAMGATPGSIVSMVLLESVFITTVAGYVGLLVSTGIIFLMSQAVGDGGEFFYNPQIEATVGIGALIILVISGALTGLIPALQASRVNPVVALKDE